MFTAVINKSAWHAVGEQIGSLLTFINRTYSETGQVKLASRDWRAEPTVEFNLLSDRRDVDRLMFGFRKMAALQMSEVVKSVADTPFPASYTDKVRKIGVVNDKNRLLTAIISRFLDGPRALRKYMIENFVVEGFTFDQVMTDDQALEDFVKKNTIGGVACLLHLPHGPRRRSDGRHRHRRPRQGRAGPACGRRLGLPDRALRQHQLSDAYDGGEDREHHPMSVILGSGEHRYRVVENWAKLPDGWSSATSPRSPSTARTASMSSTAASTR